MMGRLRTAPARERARMIVAENRAEVLAFAAIVYRERNLDDQA
jgi:hypothetical protein